MKKLRFVSGGTLTESDWSTTALPDNEWDKEIDKIHP